MADPHEHLVYKNALHLKWTEYNVKKEQENNENEISK